jgi:hypothetical protein
MKQEILLSCSYQDIELATLAAKALAKEGFSAEVTTCAINFSKVIGIVLSKDTKEETLLKENPWIQKELKHSTEARLRVMPFLIYDSGKENLETIWSASIEHIYEDLFSDEFKPLAFDLKNPHESSEELRRVLQLYFVK